MRGDVGLFRTVPEINPVQRKKEQNEKKQFSVVTDFKPFVTEHVFPRFLLYDFVVGRVLSALHSESHVNLLHGGFSLAFIVIIEFLKGAALHNLSVI